MDKGLMPDAGVGEAERADFGRLEDCGRPREADSNICFLIAAQGGT